MPVSRMKHQTKSRISLPALLHSAIVLINSYHTIPTSHLFSGTNFFPFVCIFSPFPADRSNGCFCSGLSSSTSIRRLGLPMLLPLISIREEGYFSYRDIQNHQLWQCLFVDQVTELLSNELGQMYVIRPDRTSFILAMYLAVALKWGALYFWPGSEQMRAGLGTFRQGLRGHYWTLKVMLHILRSFGCKVDHHVF